jgi:DNA-binding transcriptional MerR regulator/effector-binding domain-containing protein
MSASLAIGDFSRATHLSVKSLRHYHRIGLLEPADVDPGTGHRRYTVEQIPTAQVIRRFRSLEMPLEEIQAVITTTDVDARNALIASHLTRLEETLARTQEATASLRDLLQPPDNAVSVAVERRHVAATPAIAVREVIDAEDGAWWLQGALGELYAILTAQRLVPLGPAGGMFASDFFTHERGEATIYVPCAEPIRSTGRVEWTTVPACDLAMVTHVGNHSDVDRAYGSLASYVAEYAIGVDGPIREVYLVGGRESSDESDWRTEIGWPIFKTGSDASSTP